MPLHAQKNLYLLSLTYTYAYMLPHTSVIICTVILFHFPRIYVLQCRQTPLQTPGLVFCWAASFPESAWVLVFLWKPLNNINVLLVIIIFRLVTQKFVEQHMMQLCFVHPWCSFKWNHWKYSALLYWCFALFERVDSPQSCKRLMKLCFSLFFFFSLQVLLGLWGVQPWKVFKTACWELVSHRH